MRPIDGDALIQKAIYEADGMTEPFKSQLVEWLVGKTPTIEPETCDGCKHKGKWKNQLEYECSSPCKACKRRGYDNYETD